MENKPNVFPNMEDAMKEANEMGTQIAEQANKELEQSNKELQVEPTNIHKTKGELTAAEQMAKDTLDKLEGQLLAREELLQRKRDEAKGIISNDNLIPTQPQVTYAEPTPVKSIKLEIDDDEKYRSLSTPQDNVPYDVIPLPSEGLLYKNGKSGLKVAYLNAMDENIITNPNLLQSGKFLEILINRKLIQTDLRYKDLHVGDRNAIMLWLRATGYGPMYNITLNNPDTEEYSEFNAEIDLSKLPIKHLGIKPDENCLFDYKLPITQDNIKFRLLTVGDIENIEGHVDTMADKVGSEFTDASTYTLKKQIVSIQLKGSNEMVTDTKTVSDYVTRMRLGDVRAFRKYVNEIESGVDMNITVGTPGGGSVKTFLPLNITFFWPDLEL